MKKFLIKNKKYISLVLIAVIASGFVFLPLPVSAANPISWLVKTFIGISADALLFASSFVSYIIGAFFGIFLYLEAQIIDYLLSPENFPITNARIVQVGWSITRDLANMFFILILLIIAFATVLKIQSYAIKQLWWKVLVAALLINFSLVIAGFVVDFTNVLTTFFIEAALAGGDFWTVTTRLMASMQILNFYNPARASDILGGIAQFGAAGIAAFVGIVLTLIGSIVAVFVFGAAAVFLTVRILYLWLLMIFAPIIWMLWILPETSKYFSQWWDSFIKWAFFAPIYAFMIYLSLQMFDKTGALNVQFGGLSFPANWFEGAPGLTTAAMPAAIFQWLLVIAMMFGSLIVAQKFGVEGAKAIRGATKGAAKATGLWAIKSYGRTATALGTAAAGVGAARSPTVRIITAPIRGVGTGLRAIGGVATGAKGGKFTAPLAKTPARPLGWKSTPLSLLEAVAQGAVAGSGLWKKKKQRFKLPSGETIELEPEEEKSEEKKPKEEK